jgi:hypothetical protein
MKRLEHMAQEAVTFEDVICQLHDMLQPAAEGCYTMQVGTSTSGSTAAAQARAGAGAGAGAPPAGDVLAQPSIVRPPPTNGLSPRDPRCPAPNGGCPAPAQAQQQKLGRGVGGLRPRGAPPPARGR